jgi:hypothetical protein
MVTDRGRSYDAEKLLGVKQHVTVLDILDGRVRFTRGDFATVFPL